MTAGVSRLRVNIIKPEFNLNWYRFTEKGQGVTGLGSGEFKIYPNPVSDELTIDIPGPSGREKTLRLRSINGVKMMEEVIPENAETKKIYVGSLPKGFYILELEISGMVRRMKVVVQ